MLFKLLHLFKLFKLNKNKEEKIKTVEYNPSYTFSTDLQVLYALWFAKINGNTHQEKLESFYNKQASLYDSYRCRMLHGRQPLIYEMSAKKNDVWVDFGGGTGSNLEFFGKNIADFKQVTIVDITPSLVEVAEERITKNNWSNVNIVVGDVTDQHLSGLPKQGTVDLITISYALTMIPNWKEALTNAKRLLKPNGHIAICDFTIDSYQWSISQSFWKKLFSLDNVILNKEHINYLQDNFKCVLHDVKYGTFPYVPGVFKCPYYVFVGKKIEIK